MLRVYLLYSDRLDAYHARLGGVYLGAVAYRTAEEGWRELRSTPTLGGGFPVAVPTGPLYPTRDAAALALVARRAALPPDPTLEAEEGGRYHLVRTRSGAARAPAPPPDAPLVVGPARSPAVPPVSSPRRALPRAARPAPAPVAPRSGRAPSVPSPVARRPVAPRRYA